MSTSGTKRPPNSPKYPRRIRLHRYLSRLVRTRASSDVLAALALHAAAHVDAERPNRSHAAAKRSPASARRRRSLAVRVRWARSMRHGNACPVPPALALDSGIEEQDGARVRVRSALDRRGVSRARRDVNRFDHLAVKRRDETLPIRRRAVGSPDPGKSHAHARSHRASDPRRRRLA